MAISFVEQRFALFIASDRGPVRSRQQRGVLPAQGNELFQDAKERTRISDVFFYCWRMDVWIYRQIKLLRRCVGKAEIPPLLPLHGRARTRSVIAPLLAGKRQITLPDFIAIVNKRVAGQGQKAAIGQSNFISTQTGGQPRRIMIARDKAKSLPKR